METACKSELWIEISEYIMMAWCAGKTYRATTYFFLRLLFSVWHLAQRACVSLYETQQRLPYGSQHEYNFECILDMGLIYVEIQLTAKKGSWLHMAKQ